MIIQDPKYFEKNSSKNSVVNLSKMVEITLNGKKSSRL